MATNELREMLIALARTPDQFRRDTPMLFKSLDRIEAIKRELKTEAKRVQS